MKVKHIISTCGVLLGGLIVAQAASATVTYKTSTNVQFTFNPTLGVTISDDFLISNLAPGASKDSNDVDVTVDTNNVGGYTLSATVGDTTYDTTSLVLDSSNTFSMIGSSAASLTSGTWGYALGSGTPSSYGALDRTTPTIINKTTDASGTAASGYSGTDTTVMKIGAYAASGQRAGDYKNVINFTAVSNVVAYTVTVVPGTNVASVTPATAASYNNGTSVPITATCNSGYAFTQWINSTEYGNVADPSSASTTFTVGPSTTTLTAYCNAVAP